MASVLKVDTLKNNLNEDLLVNGYPRKPGQVIEYLSSPCDGSSVTVGSGTYTFPNVTAVTASVLTYTDVTGSNITYTPPAGTTRVVYDFHYAMRWDSDHAISHWKFFIDANEVTYARFCRSGRYPEDRYSFVWSIAIGGSANTNTGRQATWTTAKTLKMQWRSYSSGNARGVHGTTYWDGGGSTQFSMPILTIIAIA
jgi:hypothetical protein